ncbi:uncharacterized protein V6R79_019803 [Siganus canaliculatus]
MDLPCVQWQAYVAQKWTGLNSEFKEQFTSLLEVDDIFKWTLSLTTQDDLDFLQSVSSVYSLQKDTEQAAHCREKGNSSFKNRDYAAALMHYSQGICFATSSSEQLSLCYANRSAALCHLQHYQESLDDIDKAIKSGYPSNLSHKLEVRRAQCLGNLTKAPKAKEDYKKVSQNHEASDTRESLIFGLCSGAVVDFSSEKGRHLVAAERIAAGEIILSDKPYSCVLIPGMEEVKGRVAVQGTDRGVFFGMEHRLCHRCLTEVLCPVPCEGCSYSRYCSVSCQRDAWEEHHRWECSVGADLMAMGVMSQLALRVALKAGLKNIQAAMDANRESSDSHLHHTSYCSDSYLSVFHLLHHLKHHSPDLRFLYAVTVATLYLKLSQAGPPLVSHDLGRPSEPNNQSLDIKGCTSNQTAEPWQLGSAVLRHFLQLRCNAQAVVTLQDTGTTTSLVQSSKEIRIATAIFPTLSLLNHSCCPNTSLVFSTGTITDPCGSDLSVDQTESVDEQAARGVAVTVRAAKVITPGQEILHCYGPHSSRMVTLERQRLLQEQYYFLCQCEACTLQQQAQQGEDRLQQLGAGGGPPEPGFMCGKCKGSLKQSSEDRRKGLICSRSSCDYHITASEVNHKLQEIRAGLEKAVDLMERERPDEALRLLRRTQGQCGLMLTEKHPLQGELADATARAYATMGDWKKAASHLERSATAISAQYGEDSIELGRQLFKLAQLHFNGGFVPSAGLLDAPSFSSSLHSRGHLIHDADDGVKITTKGAQISSFTSQPPDAQILHGKVIFHPKVQWRHDSGLRVFLTLTGQSQCCRTDSTLYALQYRSRPLPCETHRTEDACPSSCICARDSGTVTCSDGDYSDIPGDIPEWTSTLIIREGNISTLQRGAFIINDTELEMTTLSLPYNRISVIEPYAFLGLPRLHLLDLSHNTLESISARAFHGLLELRTLYLNESLLPAATTQLSNALSAQSLRNLHRLELAGNGLQFIPLNRFDIHNLHVLVLINNSLENIERENVTNLYLQRHLRVYLSLNPFRCNCELEAFYYWLKNSSQCPDARRLLCSEPEAKRGIPVEKLSSEDVDCMNENLEAVSYVFLGIVLALIGVVFLMVLYLNRGGIKRWLNNIREACRDQMEVYHYRYEQDSDPRLANVAV